jgi:hypothetical protein
MSYVQGTVVRIYAEVFDEEGAEFVPPAVDVRVETPDGTVSTGAADYDAEQGVWFSDVDTADAAGRYRYEFGTGDERRVVGSGRFDATPALA